MSRSSGFVKKRPWLFAMVILVFCSCNRIQLLEGVCQPRNGCSSALAYYKVQPGDHLNVLIDRFQTSMDEVNHYNPGSDSILTSPGRGLLFPFPCECVNDQLSHSFTYQVEDGDFFYTIAHDKFGGLSTVDSILQANGKSLNDSIYPGQSLQVPVQCFCGDPSVTPSFGLFTTHPAVSTDSVSSLAATFNVTKTLLQLFNPSVQWSGNLTTGEILFIPSNGTNCIYSHFQHYTVRTQQITGGAGGTSRSSPNKMLLVFLYVLGGVALCLVILILWLSYIVCSRRNQPNKFNASEGAEARLVPLSGPYSSGYSPEVQSGRLKFAGGEQSGRMRFGNDQSQVSGALSSGPLTSGSLGTSGLLGMTGPLGISRPPTPNGRVRPPSPLPGLIIDKSVEFSFEELAAATDNFNVANKIGEGGYGAVYLATLRGEKTAVKRMNVQATREFLCELQILTHVHHTHLVQLIGYCTVDSLFLIYEYVENGPLERHLRSRRHGLPPLSWPARVQIAIDAARGLEYIHEHTKPTYIHRDIKASNILLDKKLRAKVADFGLTKLTETETSMSISMSRPMRLVGTFGYMAPEYAKYGDVSSMVDVYSFGVVVFEMISAKSAIVKTIQYSGDPTIPDREDQKSLVAMFEEVLKDPGRKETLRELVDPALKDDYPLESAWKMARLAADCTQENPELRPSMRSTVVTLMKMSATTHNWEI